MDYKWLINDTTDRIKSGCWEEKICLATNGILIELKWEIGGYARVDDNLELVKST